jgi:DNA-binding transcriptional ArsR family regulator
MIAGMKLDVFSQLAGGPRETAEIAKAMGFEPSRLSRLLFALTASGLLERHEAGFGNSPEAAAYLAKGSPRYIGGMHELLEQLWRADLETAKSIRSGRPAALHDFNAMSDDELSAMLRGLQPLASITARELANRFDFSRCGRAIDICGGSGGLIATLCELHPGMNGVLYDLPRTARLAEPLLRATPGGDRVAIEAGDILHASPSGSYDAAILRALVQVLAPGEAALAIALRCGAATRRGDLHCRPRHSRRQQTGACRSGLCQPGLPESLRLWRLYGKRARPLVGGRRLRRHATDNASERLRHHFRHQTGLNLSFARSAEG